MTNPDTELFATATPLVFHKITDRITYGSTNFPPARFRQLLNVLKENKIDVSLTFDDGYTHLLDLLPELVTEFELAITVFIPTAFVGRDNSWDYSHRLASFGHLDRDQIKRLSQAGIRIGSHGHNHVDLTRLDDQRLADELQKSKAILEDVTGSEIDAISYPFGRVSDQVLAAAQDRGYRVGYCMAYPNRGEAALSRGRIAVYGYDTPLSVMRKLTGPLVPLERLKNRITNSLSAGTTLLDRLSAVTRNNRNR